MVCKFGVIINPSYAKMAGCEQLVTHTVGEHDSRLLHNFRVAPVPYDNASLVIHLLVTSILVLGLQLQLPSAVTADSASLCAQRLFESQQASQQKAPVVCISCFTC